jgi:hypothetical protein
MPYEWVLKSMLGVLLLAMSVSTFVAATIIRANSIDMERRERDRAERERLRRFQACEIKSLESTLQFFTEDKETHLGDLRDKIHWLEVSIDSLTVSLDVKTAERSVLGERYAAEEDYIFSAIQSQKLNLGMLWNEHSVLNHDVGTIIHPWVITTDAAS